LATILILLHWCCRPPSRIHCCRCRLRSYKFPHCRALE